MGALHAMPGSDGRADVHDHGSAQAHAAHVHDASLNGSSGEVVADGGAAEAVNAPQKSPGNPREPPCPQNLPPNDSLHLNYYSLLLNNNGHGPEYKIFNLGRY